MRRTDRLYALVEELRARAPRALSRSELAELLEVTPRTIERDILALQESGVPIWSQRGRGGGYTIDPRSTLPPLNFDATEALAVIAALATASSLPFAEAGRRAERKLLGAMSAGEASRAKELAGRVRLGQFGAPATQLVIAAVEQAVVDRRVVEIGYRDRDGAVTSRLVEAQGLQLSPSGSYLVGWCRLRDAGRAFRLDRIVSAHPTDEIAPEREMDTLVDWIGDALPPQIVIEGGLMPARRFVSGPPRKVDNTTGSNPAFARAVATALPGVEAKSARNRTSFSVGGHVFAVVRDDDASLAIPPEGTYLLRQFGRDEIRGAIQDAWAAHAPRSAVATQRRQTKRWSDQPAATYEDIRSFALTLPGCVEGPIWGQEPGFLIGTEKRTRFLRFGPPIGSGVGNLLAPDDKDTLVILHCPQKPALLAARPDRYFATAHYGSPDEPGGIIVRLCEHRGASALAELCELVEDAWREVASPELIGQRG